MKKTTKKPEVIPATKNAELVSLFESIFVLRTELEALNKEMNAGYDDVEKHVQGIKEMEERQRRLTKELNSLDESIKIGYDRVNDLQTTINNLQDKIGAKTRQLEELLKSTMNWEKRTDSFDGPCIPPINS